MTAIAQQNAVAYTAMPVPIGALFHLTCLTPGTIVSVCMSCIVTQRCVFPNLFILPPPPPQRFGLTTVPPAQQTLPEWLTNEIWAANYWVWFHDNVWNNGVYKHVEFGIESQLKTANQTLAVGVYPSGELHVFADGKDVGTPFQNLPLDPPMYGVVGLENYGVSTRGSFRLGKQTGSMWTGRSQNSWDCVHFRFSVHVSAHNTDSIIIIL